MRDSGVRMAMLKKPWMTFSTNFWRGRMKVLRTPDSRFERLPDFDFAANYVDIDGLRMHYVDEDPETPTRSLCCMASRAGVICTGT
jgi:hypothetical protein